MKYQSELIKEIIDSRGHEKSSLHYESECVESWVEEAKGSYPKLCDYQSEWLNYINENSGIGNFPYLTLVDVTDAVVENVVPYAYKSAILKGSTKYRDIDTGEVLGGFEEGRNLELVSVKMPVLTTVGKNLFNADIVKGNRSVSTGEMFVQKGYATTNDFIPISSNQKISFSLKNTNKYRFSQFLFYDGDKSFISNSTSSTVTTPTNAKFIYIGLAKLDTTNDFTEDELVELKDMIQVEYGDKTSYEPHKTNILTVSEDVTLRGIGAVQDTLDLLTGEVVQNIGEIVLDGNEDWIRQGVSQNNSNLGIYYSPKALPNTIFNTNNVLCDKFKTSKTMTWHSSEEDIYVSISTYGLKICFDERKLESATVGGLKKWLSENTPTIQYPLVEKPVKTVDLTIIDQDGNTLSKIKPIEGTMVISTDGTPIKPLLSAEIPVEATTQNLSSFIDLEME